MDKKKAQQLAIKLSAVHGLSGEIHCSKFTEMAYLYHFVECYKPSMSIDDWQNQPVYILNDAGVKTAIAFCDLQLPPYLSSAPEKEVPYLQQEAVPIPISALWLVFVASNRKGDDEQFRTIITRHGLSSIFDKILLFDFFQSTIQIIN